MPVLRAHLCGLRLHCISVFHWLIIGCGRWDWSVSCGLTLTYETNFLTLCFHSCTACGHRYGCVWELQQFIVMYVCKEWSQKMRIEQFLSVWTLYTSSNHSDQQSKVIFILESSALSSWCHITNNILMFLQKSNKVISLRIAMKWISGKWFTQALTTSLWKFCNLFPLQTRIKKRISRLMNMPRVEEKCKSWLPNQAPKHRFFDRKNRTEPHNRIIFLDSQKTDPERFSIFLTTRTANRTARQVHSNCQNDFIRLLLSTFFDPWLCWLYF